MLVFFVVFKDSHVTVKFIPIGALPVLSNKLVTNGHSATAAISNFNLTSSRQLLVLSVPLPKRCTLPSLLLIYIWTHTL